MEIRFFCINCFLRVLRALRGKTRTTRDAMRARTTRDTNLPPLVHRFPRLGRLRLEATLGARGRLPWPATKRIPAGAARVTGAGAGGGVTGREEAQNAQNLLAPFVPFRGEKRLRGTR